MADNTPREHEQVVIIGSGPAGWTAAIYAARAQLEPLVFEGAGSRTMIPGGQLMFTTEVENFPGFKGGVMGQDLMMEMRAQAQRFGTRILTEDVVNVDVDQRPFVLTSSRAKSVKADAIIIATGANAKWIGLENEERLAHSGGGVSACAVCDGALPPFRNQVLAVVGGGDSAMEEAEYLTKFAKQVLLIHRRDEFRASKIMADRVLANPKIEMAWNKTVKQLVAGQNGILETLILEDTQGGPDGELAVTGCFIAIGHIPNTAFLEGQLEVDDHGYLVLHGPTGTSVEGVFACGDVMDPTWRQAITAAGTGCSAAIAAERWLEAQHG